MAIYVDELCFHGWVYRGGAIRSCHLFADTVKELHTFAREIGLKRSWFQDKNIPHYDLTKGKRSEALQNGAKEVDKHQAVDIWKRIRK